MTDWWEKWYELHRVDLVAAAQFLRRRNKNGSKNRVLEPWRQNWLWGKTVSFLIEYVAKIIVRDFLDRQLFNSINKFLALHCITGWVVRKGLCSCLLADAEVQIPSGDFMINYILSFQNICCPQKKRKVAVIKQGYLPWKFALGS